MDIEDLNKSQIILLTLLVSFVTSIATGIVTVSLMEKAPKDVVRVTQRIVEHTIEKVQDVGAENKKEDKNGKEKVIVQEKTIIIKEGDLIAQSIERVKSKIAVVYNKADGEFVAFAYPVSNNEVITDASVLQQGVEYALRYPDGKIADLSIEKKGGVRRLALLKVLSDKNLSSVTVSKESPKLGQTLFYFKDKDLKSVSRAIVSDLSGQFIITDSSSKNILPATAIFDSSGAMVGISTLASRSDSPVAFVKYSSIDAFLSQKDLPQEDDTTTAATDETNDEQTNETNTDANNGNSSDNNNLGAAAANSESDQDSDAGNEPGNSDSNSQND